MAYLTEQGLYFFLARSDKPQAIPMQRWVAGDVLPTIRKTGRYEPASKSARRCVDGLAPD
jgi:prophage antirepressor-like protein